jgi:beta-N-acetylhexosaminidase
VNKSFDELMRVEIPPFRRAITAQVGVLMTAHVLYPALDPDLPATLSPSILTGLLRRKLNYRGLVISDDLEMGAIVSHFSVGEAAVMALQAGADLLLVCHCWARARVAREACERALGSGALPRSRLDEACHRVAMLKKIHFRSGPRPPLSAVGSPEHQQLVKEIQQRSVGSSTVEPG